MLRNSLLYDEGAREQVTQERGGMERVRRVLVSVCRDRAAPQSVHFLQSVTGHFGTTDQVNVSCSLDRNRLIVLKDDTDRGIPLKCLFDHQRAPFCPIKHLSVKEAASISLDIQQRGVDVGVAIILQTADKRVLLTRRAKQLRIFPNVWVPPGGHLEPDETLLEAGLRELKEETGLALEAEQFPSPKVLVSVPPDAEQRTPSETPPCRLPAAALAMHTPAAPGCRRCALREDSVTPRCRRVSLSTGHRTAVQTWSGSAPGQSSLWVCG
ncbi:nucleoside diphosphate-linked moiety X motif 17 isoform X4 [Dunckerocampus dactyliophorus]|uniref:nucleoside diphosphate-linked moiety X motif 17 isoform X4 n=1 Tax=Dunckerocampus dactyliophorus TaxID=161453 RepID=UPI002405F574|nr:nucleoside diphosphate-linked moiety X motif 17 isoform X4 [Dunckerocampus dactyliophorus]